jgi:hypothetical protein
VVVIGFGPCLLLLLHQLGDAHPALDRIVVVERQRRGALEVQLGGNPRL